MNVDHGGVRDILTGRDAIIDVILVIGGGEYHIGTIGGRGDLAGLLRAVTDLLDYPERLGVLAPPDPPPADHREYAIEQDGDMQWVATCGCGERYTSSQEESAIHQLRTHLQASGVLR